MMNVRYRGKEVPERMPSSSLSYSRAMVIAERRSPWADLLFLEPEKKSGDVNMTFFHFSLRVVSYLPDTNAGLDWLSVLHLRLLL